MLASDFPYPKTVRLPIQLAREGGEDVAMFNPGHNALRKGRWSEPGRIYLVTFTTQERRPLFRNFNLAAVACRTFAESAHASGAELVCWVLMPDHFHALVQLGETSDLSRCVQRLKGQSSAACRTAMVRSGPVWARAFHDRALRADEDVGTSARYVIANPVRAGLVDDVLLYPYWDAFWLNG